MPLTCGNIGMGEPPGRGLDTPGEEALNHLKSITARRTPCVDKSRLVRHERSADDAYRLRLRTAVDADARQPPALLSVRPAGAIDARRPPFSDYPLIIR